MNNAADKLTSISVGGNTVRSFTYDYLGRRKTDTHSGATTTYTWDQESRIASIARTGMSTHTFRYNGLDTRTSKTVGSATTSYLRNGAYVTDGVMKEVTGSTTTNHTPGISEKRGSALTQYLHSGLKNADARTSGQAIDATRQYDAFGNLTDSSGTWSGPFGYAGGFGYQEDSEAGLKLLGHRYYDSTTGRFLSKDPVSFGRNWYGYADNSPVIQMDPDGLEPMGPPPNVYPGVDRWKYYPSRKNGRGGTWGPEKPVPGGFQPNASWDDKDGHWDVTFPNGERRRYTRDGKFISAANAHGKASKNYRNSRFGKAAARRASAAKKSAGGLARGAGRAAGVLGAVLFLVDAAQAGPLQAAKNATFQTDIENAAKALTAHGQSFQQQQRKVQRQRMNRRSGGALDDEDD